MVAGKQKPLSKVIVIIDANIIFSTLINPRSSVGKIVMERQYEIILIAPDFLKREISKHLPRIAKYLKINIEETFDLVTEVFSLIHFYPDEIIPPEIINHAVALTNDIDPKDMIYISFALFFQCRLWSGDKKLIEGIKAKGLDIFVKPN